MMVCWGDPEATLYAATFVRGLEEGLKTGPQYKPH
jgi:hypothetical protein